MQCSCCLWMFVRKTTALATLQRARGGARLEVKQQRQNNKCHNYHWLTLIHNKDSTPWKDANLNWEKYSIKHNLSCDIVASSKNSRSQECEGGYPRGHTRSLSAAPGHSCGNHWWAWDFLEKILLLDKTQSHVVPHFSYLATSESKSTWLRIGIERLNILLQG